MTVGGGEGAFLSGDPHFLLLLDELGNPVEDSARLAANVLLWERGRDRVPARGRRRPGDRRSSSPSRFVDGRPRPAARLASAPCPSTPVRELELDLDAFEGPFDLLLTLLLKEELEPREIDMAAIVLSFVEILAERERARPRGLRRVPRARLGAARAEGARALPRRGGRARRSRARGGGRGAGATARRVPADEGGRRLARRAARSGAGALVPARAGAARSQRRATARAAGRRRARGGAPRARGAAAQRLARAHGASLPARVPVPRALPRAALAGARRFDFDAEVGGLSRVEQAVAFLALLELRKAGEIALGQAAPFAPIRVSRSRRRKDATWTARSA